MAEGDKQNRVILSFPGKYRPTLALLRDPGNLMSGDGSKYTYTIVVE